MEDELMCAAPLRGLLATLRYQGRHEASADVALGACGDPAYVGKHRAESTS